MKNRGPLKSRSLKTFAGVPLLFADEGQELVVEGEVIWVREAKTLLSRVRTETSTIEVRIFHPTAFHRRSFVRGAQVKLRGKLTRWHGRPCLVHPKIILR
jgi:RecG-like helicase